MSARRQLADLAHALNQTAEVDDAGRLEAWHRRLVFKLDQVAPAKVWEGLPCEGKPPRAWLLWERDEGGRVVYELLWAPEGVPEDQWPVVELSSDGEAQVVAANASDYIDALLYTGGLVGGGTDEDLENGRHDASVEAMRLGDDVAEELDREDVDLEVLGDRYETAQDRFADAWYEAVEAGN